MTPRVLVLALCLSAVAFAQTDTATITGLVTDASQAALPGAAIEAANRATGLKYRASTNEAGAYSVPPSRSATTTSPSRARASRPSSAPKSTSMPATAPASTCRCRWAR